MAFLYPQFHGKDGEDVSDFLEQMEMACITNHVMEEEKMLRLLQLCLKGEARVWLNIYEEELQASNPPVALNLEDLKDALVEEFVKVEDPNLIWQELNVLKQRKDQSVTEFAGAFNKMWAQWSDSLGDEVPPLMFKKSMFIAGLSDILQFKVDLKRPSTFEEAVRIAESKEWKLKKVVEWSMVEEQKVNEQTCFDVNLVDNCKQEVCESVQQAPTKYKQVDRGVYQIVAEAKKDSMPKCVIPVQSLEKCQVFNEVSISSNGMLRDMRYDPSVQREEISSISRSAKEAMSATPHFSWLKKPINEECLPKGRRGVMEDIRENEPSVIEDVPLEQHEEVLEANQENTGGGHSNEEEEPMESTLFEENSKGVGNLQEAEEVVFEQPFDMDSLCEVDFESNEQVIEDHVEVDVAIELLVASAQCEKNLGKEILDRLMREWCSQVVMNLLLSKAVQRVMHIQWCLLGMHIWGKDFQKDQEIDVEEEDAYVLKFERDAMSKVDGEFYRVENICYELGNEKPIEWGANVFMYMLLNVAIQWAVQVQIYLELIRMEPYQDDAWSMNEEGWFEGEEPRACAVLQSQVVFDPRGIKMDEEVTGWLAATLWPYDPGGHVQLWLLLLIMNDLAG